MHSRFRPTNPELGKMVRGVTSQGELSAVPKDIRRVTIDHLMVDWLVEGVDLRLHFFYYVDGSRLHDDAYIQELHNLKRRRKLPIITIWPYDFGKRTLPIIADHFNLTEPGRITMELIMELASWDTVIRRICVIAPPSEESLIRLATKINNMLIS